MTAPAKKILVLALVLALLAGAVAFAASRYQRYRVQKIEFIVWDREHDNVADLTDADLIRYVQACGAETVRSRDRLHISYRGLFRTREWTVSPKEK